MRISTDAIRDIIRRLWSGQRGRTLLAVSLGWFLFFGFRLVFPPLLPHLQAEFDLSYSRAGLLLTLLGTAYAIGQFPGGLLSDRYGERMIMIAGAIAAAVSTTLLTFATASWILYVATFTFGTAIAVFAPARYVIISKIYDRSDSTAMAVVSSAGNIGAAILPAIVGFVAGSLTWRMGFGVAIPLFLATGLGLLLVVPATPSPPESNRRSAQIDSGRRSPRNESDPAVGRLIGGLKQRSVLLLVLVMICHSVIFQGFTTFYPTYLITEKGFSSAASSTVFGLFFGIGIVTKMIGGVVSDAFGKKQTVTALLLALSVGLFSLTWAQGLAGVVGVTILITGLLGIVPVTTAYITKALSDDITGSGLGIIRTIYILIGSISPFIVGSLAEVGSFDAAFLLLSAVALVGSGVTLFVPPAATNEA